MTTTLRQAAQAALEALEAAAESIESWSSYAGEHFRQRYNMRRDITALRAALSRPDQHILAPLIPTDSMVHAGKLDLKNGGNLRTAYRAMLTQVATPVQGSQK